LGRAHCGCCAGIAHRNHRQDTAKFQAVTSSPNQLLAVAENTTIVASGVNRFASAVETKNSLSLGIQAVSSAVARAF